MFIVIMLITKSRRTFFSWSASPLRRTPSIWQLTSWRLWHAQRCWSQGCYAGANGNLLQQDHGYWVEIHAWRVESSTLIPHGVRYALTLHQLSVTRVLGYDNAHAVKPSGRFKFAGQVLPYDHKHRS